MTAQTKLDAKIDLAKAVVSQLDDSLLQIQQLKASLKGQLTKMKEEQLQLPFPESQEEQLTFDFFKSHER